LRGILLVIILLLHVSGLLEPLDRTFEVPRVEEFELLTVLGGDVAFALFAIFVLLLDVKEGGRPSKRTLAFLGSALVGMAVVVFLKVTVGGPRPTPLPDSNFLSEGAFPSGHTFRAAIIASYVSDRWKKLAPLAWTYALAVALSRLFLHYHWLSDVLFSLLLAPWLYDLFKRLLGVEECSTSS